MTTTLANEYKLRPYDPNIDRSALNDICANVYGGGDYLPKVAGMYVNDPLCSFMALAECTACSNKNHDGIDEKIVAVANYKRLPSQKSAWIEGVRTHPDHQNKGLASLLLRELIALAQEEDRSNNAIGPCRTRVLTCTIESNKGMQRALTKVGFQRYGKISTVSFATLKQLPGWSAECQTTPEPLLTALKLDHLIRPEARSIAASSNCWRTIASEEELLVALKECQQHGGTCGYLPGLYEYIVPSRSRIDLQQSIQKGLVYSLNIYGKDTSGCDDNYSPIQAEKAILAFTKDERISSLKSQWVCSIVAHTELAFEAALVYAHSDKVTKQMQLLRPNGDSTVMPFCLVFDDAVPLIKGGLAHALPRVTDECVVFHYTHLD